MGVPQENPSQKGEIWPKQNVYENNSY